MYLSLVIPTYRRKDALRRNLDALRTQTLSPDEFEVIVSIDGSEDGTREMLAELSTPYRLLSLWQTNQGRAAACNAGIRQASGQVVVILDDDMEPAPQFLASHCEAHQASSNLGVLGAVPVKIEESDSPLTRYMGEKFNLHLAELENPAHRFKLRDFYSGNFSIRRETLLDAGLFDEDFKIYGNEDLELAVRLVQHGVKIIYSPQALAYQHYEKDFGSLARDQVAKGKTATLLAKKHPEVLPEMKLSTREEGSRQWRMARGALLALSRLVPAIPQGVTGAVQLAERRRFSKLDVAYQFALDYFFWLGVEDGA